MVGMELNDNELQKMVAGVKIPPCPTLLLEVIKEARRPDADLDRIVQPVMRDAGMSAALLKLANSPLYTRGRQISSVRQAISVLGMRATINLLNHVALLQSMADDPPDFAKFWERSALAASTASWLARKLPTISQAPRSSPDDAYIAGLFHDCGIPILMRTYPDYRQTMVTRANMGKHVYEVEDEVYSTNHAVVGSMMARTWFLPEAVYKTILFHHDTTIFAVPSEHVPQEITLLIGIVNMAEMLVDEHFCQKNPDWEEIETDVLHYFEIAEQDFAELKDDALGWLNGE